MHIPADNCCGCSACSQICPKQAITVKNDSKGFYIPDLDQHKCNGCGLCRKVCPEGNEISFPLEPVNAVAIKSSSKVIREKSTSGGAFSVFSDYILSNGGVVFGTVYDEAFKAVIVKADCVGLRDRMRGSKYVESDAGDSFRQCAKSLGVGQTVFFTGTPCQIAGLNGYLSHAKVKTDGLYTCQIICHGVPSPKIFRDHVIYMQQKRDKQVIGYYHRPKTWGWHEHNEMICYDDGKEESQSKSSQNHKDLFYAGYSLRECCFRCKYAGKFGIADITIGDFWGIEHIMPEFDDNKGTSILLMNTEKGKELFERIPKDTYVTRDVKVRDAVRYNHVRPSRKPIRYDEFWRDYDRYRFAYIAKKYAKDKYPGKIIYYSKKWMRRILVKFKLLGY